MYRSFGDESKIYFSKKGVGYMGIFGSKQGDLEL